MPAPYVNTVKSFVVKSPNPEEISDIVVNHTVPNQHFLDEGFVMQFERKDKEGNGIAVAYREGNSIAQSRDPLGDAYYGPDLSTFGADVFSYHLSSVYR